MAPVRRWLYPLSFAAPVVLMALLLSFTSHALPARWEQSLVGLHTLLEFAGLVIAFMAVAISWHTFDQRTDSTTNALMGGFIVVGICDLFHTLTFQGMPALLTTSDASRAIFFWLMGRTAEVLTITVIGFGWVPRARRLPAATIGLAVSLAIVVWGSFALEYFPVTYVDGQGLTPFKRGAEYALSVVNLGLCVLLWRKGTKSGSMQLRCLAFSCYLMAVGGFAFSAYNSPGDLLNVTGHIYKLAAYLFAYWAVYLKAVLEPYQRLRESDRQVRDSQSRLRALGANLTDMVLYQSVIEPNGQRRIVEISDSVEAVLGVSAEDAKEDLGRLYSRFEDGSQQEFFHAQKQAMAGMTPMDFQARLKRDSGPSRIIRVVARPRKLPNGAVLWDGVMTDITEQVQAGETRKALEAQLKETQKLEALGTLASGIAHDFNNSLAAILGNLSMALEDVKKLGAPATVTALQQARIAAEHSRELVRQILLFSRKEPVKRQVQPLGPIVDETVGILKASLPASVELAVVCGTNDVWAEVDKGQLEQVLINLCTNAWQSMDRHNGGRIELGYGMRTVSGADAQRFNVMPGDYATIWVADNGTGIPSNILNRIFEPFFTTKPAGEGTGLGLSVVHGIVQAHQGAISVESTPAKGTRFDIVLPGLRAVAPSEILAVLAATEQKPETPEQPAKVLIDGVGHGERVLYVDDVDIMSMMVERLLSRANYRVTLAHTPDKALELLLANPDAFDVLVTDYSMPRMSGLDLIEKVRALRPELPTVLTSGFVTEELHLRAKELGVSVVLEKQHTFEELGRSLRQAVSRATSSSRHE